MLSKSARAVIRHTRRHLPFARAFIREINKTCELHKKTLLAPALFERYFQLRINISKAKV